jgi:hypothetical protein
MADQFVSVPVPVDRVVEVYRLLASPPSGMSKPETVKSIQSGEDWTWLVEHTNEKADWPIKVIHRAVTESNTGQRAFLKYLAEHPGESLTTQQAAEALKVERKDIAGALSGLSRRAKSRYGQTGWFFAAQWDGAQFSYCMDQREADAVLDILARK